MSIARIMMGPSGSGKSKIAEAMMAEVVSADKLPGLYREDGSIDFSLLSDAHNQCLAKFMLCVGHGLDVTVDNTNTTLVEIAPYIAVANALGATVEVVCVGFRSAVKPPRDPAIAAYTARNVHSVPEHVIFRQISNLFETFQNWPAHWPTVTFKGENQ